MKHWYLLASNVDVMPLTGAIMRQPELWDQPQFLKQFYPFNETDVIYLRFPKIGDEAWDRHESINTPAWDKLPEAHSHVFNLMSVVRGVRLGRVMVNRLAPGAVIAKHTDLAEHTARWRRYHLVLHGLPGAVMRVVDQVVPMQTGMLFWLDNRVEHEVANGSSDDRLSMVIDIQTADIDLAGK